MEVCTTDVKKVNQLALKNFYSKNDRDILYGKYDDKIAIVDKGVRIFFLDLKDFVLDLDKVYKNRDLININKIVGNLNDYEPVTMTNELRMVNNIQCVKITSGDYVGWFNTKLLADYGKNVEFKGLKSTIGRDKDKVIHTVLVYDNLEQLIGLLLACRIKDV